MGSQTLSPDVLQRLLAARGRFLGFLEKRVGSRATAEDILQAAFVKGLEKGGELRDEESAVAWFYRLLRNAVIDHYRRQASTARALEDWARELDLHQAPPEPLRGEVCECVSALLTTLRPEYQDAIQAVDLEESSLAQLAERQGITAGNAAVRVHRARQALRRQVRAACGACAEHGCLECGCKK